MLERTSTLIPPPRRWWGPMGRDEQTWVAVVLMWSVAMFVMIMFVWPAIGEQQLTFKSYRVEPAQFQSLAEAFIAEHQVDEQFGIPVVAPPPGDVYLLGQRFQFKPILRLQAGETYRFLISSADVQHGLSLQPDNINFQVLPGYVSAVEMTPKQGGEYGIVCNEFCGTGHHLMVGRIVVEGEGGAP